MTWDPKGVFYDPEAQSEYDACAGRLARMLREGAGLNALEAELADARYRMGLPANDVRREHFVAQHLLAWHARSTSEPEGVTLYWDVAEAASVATVEDLDRLLDRLAEEFREKPVRATLGIDSGSVLSIGVGRDMTVLAYVGPDPGAPPYYVSLGDEAAPHEEVAFYWSGEYSPCLRSHLIAGELGRDAARLFLEQGKLSRAVRWTEN